MNRFLRFSGFLTVNLVIVVLLLFSVTGLANEVLDAIDEGYYLVAKELFESKMLGNIYLEAEVYEGLDTRIQEAVDNFNTKVWSYSKSNLVLKCIIQSEIIADDSLMQATDLLEVLHLSHKAFDLGLSHLEDDNYFLAKGQFAQVVYEDKQYEEARDLYLQAHEEFEKSFLIAAEEALCQDDFKSALGYLDAAISLEPLDSFLEKRFEYARQWSEHARQKLEETIDQFSHRLISLDEAEVVLWELQADGHYDADFIQRKLIFLNRLQISQEAFDAANEYFEQGDYPNALEQYTRVSEDDFNYDKAMSKAADALQNFRDYYTSDAYLALEKHDYQQALAIIEEGLALRHDPTLKQVHSSICIAWEDYEIEQLLAALDLFDRRVKTYQETQDFLLASRADNILEADLYEESLQFLDYLDASQRAFEYGEKYLADDQYLAAIEQYNLVFEEDSYFTEAETKKALAKDKYVKSIGVEVRAAIANNKFDEALAIVDAAIKNLDIGDLHQLRTIVEEEETQFFIEQKLRLANDAFNVEGNFIEGQKIIQEGLERFPDNEDFLAAMEYYAQFAPVRLLDLKPVVTEGGSISVTTSNKGVYDNAMNWYDPRDCFWVVSGKATVPVNSFVMVR